MHFYFFSIFMMGYACTPFANSDHLLFIDAQRKNHLRHSGGE